MEVADSIVISEFLLGLAAIVLILILYQVYRLIEDRQSNRKN
jgi:chromate transport protein ChrA